MSTNMEWIISVSNAGGSATLTIEGSTQVPVCPPIRIRAAMPSGLNKGDEFDMTLTRTFDFTGQFCTAHPLLPHLV